MLKVECFYFLTADECGLTLMGLDVLKLFNVGFYVFCDRWLDCEEGAIALLDFFD
ncbi:MULTISPECIES: hypothetical protein [unclassified Microcoleus]|uniref:hypothetical protein n=1 Tax=unclassified Microcoleus TaxID=2642155 RepID=UPI002FD01099